jgi:hypothetical protein
MNIFQVISFFWVVGVIFIGLKVVKDQIDFPALYRDKIDPTYPLSPAELRQEINNSKADRVAAIRILISSTVQKMRMLFAYYPKYPELNALASKIRSEFIIGLAITFGGFIILAVLSYRLNH